MDKERNDSAITDIKIQQNKSHKKVINMKVGQHYYSTHLYQRMRAFGALTVLYLRSLI